MTDAEISATLEASDEQYHEMHLAKGIKNDWFSCPLCDDEEDEPSFDETGMELDAEAEELRQEQRVMDERMLNLGVVECE